MGPVLPILITVGKVAGTALALKTAADGLKEGNLLKAVVGGIGAYAGISGFMGGAGSAANLGTGASSEAAAQSFAAAGSDLSPEILGSALGTEAAHASVQGLAGNIINNAGGALGGAGNLAGEAGVDLLGSSGLVGKQLANAGGSGSLFGDVGRFVKDNKELVSLGGGAAQSYAQQKAAEETAEQNRDFIRSRDNRGYAEAGASRDRLGAQTTLPADQQEFLRKYASGLFARSNPVIRSA